jgi:hypothetical protein
VFQLALQVGRAAGRGNQGDVDDSLVPGLSVANGRLWASKVRSA